MPAIQGGVHSAGAGAPTHAHGLCRQRRSITPPNAAVASVRIDALPVEFGIVPEDVALVEGLPALACQIRLDARPFGDGIAMRSNMRSIAQHALGGLREGVEQPLD